MSVSRIRYSDLLRMWKHSKNLMDISAIETSNPDYVKIVEKLDWCIHAISNVIDNGGDLEILVEDDGVVKAGSSTYIFDLTEEEIAGIKDFGWANIE